MNDPTIPGAINGETWPAWLQQAMWLEWIQPYLYALLTLAVICLVLALLDLAMLCWKEFHPTGTQAMTKARTKAAPVREVKNVTTAAQKLLSHM